MKREMPMTPGRVRRMIRRHEHPKIRRHRRSRQEFLMAPIDERISEERITAIVLAVIQAHREEFHQDPPLTADEVRATILTLIAEQPELMLGPRGFPGRDGRDGRPPSYEEVKKAVQEFIRDHREEFRGRSGERGPRGYTGDQGGRGERGPTGRDGRPGESGRPPTRGEIAAAVAIYVRAERQANEQSLQGTAADHFIHQEMRGAVQRHREEHPEEQDQPAPRDALFGRTIPLWAALAAVLAVAMLAMFFPRGGIDEETLGTMVEKKVATYMSANADQFIGPAGPTGQDGKDGATTEQVVANLKTDPAFMAAAEGERGDPGQPGSDGKDGATAEHITADLKADPTFMAAIKGDKGEPGSNGNDGRDGATIRQIIEGLKADPALTTTLKGEQGPEGPPGQKGDTGKDGITLEEVLAAIDADPTTVGTPIVSYLKSCFRNGVWHSGNGDSGGWTLPCPDGTIVLAFSEHATERLRAEIEAK